MNVLARLERLLIVEDRESDLESYSRGLDAEYDVVPARTLEEAKLAASRGISIALSDIRLSERDHSNRDGLVFLEWLKVRSPEVPVVMMTAYNDMDLAVQALNKGAEYFIRKPINLRELRTVLRNLAKQVYLQRRSSDLEERLSQYEPWHIIGESEPIKKLKKSIGKAAQDGKVTVLITGETGTGKELVARAIYRQGPRKNESFVDESLKVREGSGGLLESLLFGHEKGAFTDAIEQHIGVFERANGGVLFLDEIGELDQATQVKLLRVLETRTFRRMGGTQDISVDIQLVAATNRSLERAVSEKAFREDLYFRLNVYEIHTPPLREMVSDIPALASYFLDSFRAQGRTSARSISQKALKLLQSYSWPGNARELSNYIERASIFADDIVMPEHLPDVVRSNESLFGDSANNQFSIPNDGADLSEELARTELRYLEAALRTAQGKKNEAWRLLGLNDRFAFGRRVKAIASKYPHLLECVPYLRDQYGNQAEIDDNE